MKDYFPGAFLIAPEGRHDRRVLVPRVLVLVLAAFVLWLLVGCATTEERYMTAEQDARMREVCQPAGCEVIPSPAWAQIEQILSMLGLRMQ